MIKETIEELRELKTRLERTQQYYGADPCEDVYTLDKAIIACEQLRKARKKAKRWKRKYLRMVEICKEIKSDPSEVLEDIEQAETCEGCTHPCIMYEPKMKACERKHDCEDAKSTKEVMKILTMLMDEAGKDGKLILSDAKEMIMDLPNVQPNTKGEP